jgi:hypothetical protein
VGSVTGPRGVVTADLNGQADGGTTMSRHVRHVIVEADMVRVRVRRELDA